MAKANTPTMMEGTPMTTLATMRMPVATRPLRPNSARYTPARKPTGMAISAAPAVMISVPTMALAMPPLLDSTSSGVGCVKKARFHALAPRMITS